MTAVAKKTSADVAAPAGPPIDMGLDASDMGILVMSFAHSSRACVTDDDNQIKFGDVVIGASADDPDTEILLSKKATTPLRFYVAAPVRKWYAPAFKDKDKYNGEGVKNRWDIGDEDVPPGAELNYCYTLLVPEHSLIMPVHYYVRGTAERAMKPLVNKIRAAALGGVFPYTFCWGLLPHYNTGKGNSWYTPMISLEEPDEAEVAAAKAVWDSITAPARKALEAGDGGEPTF